MNRGVPPTDLKARTGEFTPPGMTAQASSNSRAEVAVREAVCSALDMRTSVPASTWASTTGCSGRWLRRWCVLVGDVVTLHRGHGHDVGLGLPRGDGTA